MDEAEAYAESVKYDHLMEVAINLDRSTHEQARRESITPALWQRAEGVRELLRKIKEPKVDVDAFLRTIPQGYDFAMMPRTYEDIEPIPWCCSDCDPMHWSLYSYRFEYGVIDGTLTIELFCSDGDGNEDPEEEVRIPWSGPPYQLTPSARSSIAYIISRNSSWNYCQGWTEYYLSCMERGFDELEQSWSTVNEKDEDGEWIETAWAEHWLKAAADTVEMIYPICCKERMQPSKRGWHCLGCYQTKTDEEATGNE